MTSSSRVLGSTWVATVLLCLVGTLPVAALTFDVTNPADSGDANPGDGVCATTVGPCTLRAAIEEANALGGTHTINLPYDAYLGGFMVTANVTIVGLPGGPSELAPTVTGGSPTFKVDLGAHLTLLDFEIHDGTAPTYGDAGCITNWGTLDLSGMIIAGCSGRQGGAIHNAGTLTMSKSTVETSWAVEVTTDNYEGHGGGLYATGQADLTEVEFRSNGSDQAGAAIYVLGSTLTLTDGRVALNTSSANCGGVEVISGAAEISRLALVDNSAATDLAHAICLVNSTTDMANVTVANHGTGSAVGVDGGTTTLRSMSLVGNDTAVLSYAGSTINMLNSLLANNTVNCVLGDPLTSFGHNLEDANDCGLLAASDQVNTTPLLGAIGMHGGFGETIPLLEGSPGIDDGDHALAPPTDQRGIARFDGDGDGTVTADVGAYEYDVLFGDGFETGDTTDWSGWTP